MLLQLLTRRHTSHPSKRTLVGTSLAVFAFQVFASFGCTAQTIEVTAIANEGFLIRSSRHAVLVDALFRATAPYPEFFQQGPSETLVQRMIDGDGEFLHIDLALVTHSHGDHFHPQTAMDFLRAHPETMLVGTETVVQALAALDGFDDISSRVVSPTQTIGSCNQALYQSIEVTACLVAHSGGREPANNIFVVDLDGFLFLHEGDADMTFEAFAGVDIGERQLDLAFMHDWYVLNDGRPVVTDLLQPRAVVLMHHRWERAAETQERVDQLQPEVASSLPLITVFTTELESKMFNRADSNQSTGPDATESRS